MSDFRDACAKLRTQHVDLEVDLTPCPDCGACPAQLRCECDSIGTRKQRELDAARAEVAMLREALEPFMRWAAQLDAAPNWAPDGCPILASPGDISDFSVGQLRKVRTALSTSPSDRLARYDADLMARAEKAEAERDGLAAAYEELWESTIPADVEDAEILYDSLTHKPDFTPSSPPVTPGSPPRRGAGR